MRVHRRLLLAQLFCGASTIAISGRALAQSVSYTYDALGRVVTITYPNGAAITYT
jgi:YD repeat-containing protein